MDPRLKYLLHHTTWQPTVEGSLHLLHTEGAKITLEEYDHDQKHFFCPRCGYQCLRVPGKKLVDARGKKAYFRHYPGDNPRNCPFWIQNYQGKNYTKSLNVSRTIEDDFLVKIHAWKLEVDQIEYELKANEYHGIHEDQRGMDSNELISRHKANNIIHSSQITTVQYIANVLPEISYKHIVLPGYKEAFLFSEVFIHSSEITSESIDFNALYWGKVQQTCIVDNYCCIAFGYENYCVYFAYPLRHATERKWDAAFLKGKNIIVAGTPQPTQKFQAKENNQGGNRICLKIEAQAWGAAGVIPRDNERFLEDYADVKWIDPPIFGIPTTQYASTSVDSQESLNDFEGEDKELNSIPSEADNDPTVDSTQETIDVSESLNDEESWIETTTNNRQNEQLVSPERKQFINYKKHVTVIHEWPSAMKDYQVLIDELALITERSASFKSLDPDSPLINPERASLYLDNERVACSELDSLFPIAGELERYLNQFIQIPGIPAPKPFIDIFCHVYDFKARYTDEPNIYWGLIDSINIVDEDIVIAFNYQQVVLVAKISELAHKEQYWTPKYLKGKLIMFTGKAQKIFDEIPDGHDSVQLGREEWHVTINSPMQAAIINSDIIETLTLQDGRSWREIESPDILTLYDRPRISQETEFPLIS